MLTVPLTVPRPGVPLPVDCVSTHIEGATEAVARGVGIDEAEADAVAVARVVGVGDGSGFGVLEVVADGRSLGPVGVPRAGEVAAGPDVHADIIIATRTTSTLCFIDSPIRVRCLGAQHAIEMRGSVDLSHRPDRIF